MQEGGQVPRSRVARSGCPEMNCGCSSQDKVITPSSAASSVKGCLGAHPAGLVARMECNLQWNMLSTRLWACWLWCHCCTPVSFRAGPGESVPCPSRQSPLWGEMPTPPVPGTTSRAAHGRTFQGVWESHGCVSLWRVGEGPQDIPPTSTLGVLALQGAEDPHALTLHGLPGSGYREVLADYPIPLGCFSPSITHQEPASRQQGAISLPCPPQSHPF